MALNVDPTLHLLDQRSNEPIAKRSFSTMQHAYTIIPDQQFNAPRLPTLHLDEDRS